MRQKEFDHFFFVFGTLSVTFRSLFLMLLSLFSSLFCQTPFAGLLLWQGDFSNDMATKVACYNGCLWQHLGSGKLCPKFGNAPKFSPSQHRGPCDRKKSIPIENFNPGSNFSSPIEIFNLDRKFQSASFHLRGPRSVHRRCRSKISIHDRSLEIFNPEGRDRIFSIPGPSGLDTATALLSSSQKTREGCGCFWGLF